MLGFPSATAVSLERAREHSEKMSDHGDRLPRVNSAAPPHTSKRTDQSQAQFWLEDGSNTSTHVLQCLWGQMRGEKMSGQCLACRKSFRSVTITQAVSCCSRGFHMLPSPALIVPQGLLSASLFSSFKRTHPVSITKSFLAEKDKMFLINNEMVFYFDFHHEKNLKNLET